MLDYCTSSSSPTIQFNTTTNTTHFCDDIFQFVAPELSYAIPVGIILGLFTVLTVGGNLLVLVAVATDRHLRSQRHTLLIVNLAIFDMTLGSVVFPFSATLEIFNDQWLFGRIFCSVWAAIDVLCCTGSIWSLVSIALDRLVGVTKPLAYAGIMTRKKMLLMILIIWTLSVVISVVPFMGWSTPEQKNPYVCSVQQDFSYVLFSCSVSYYIPLLIILIFYSRIYQAASRHVNSMRTGVKRGSEANTDGSVMTLRIHTKRFEKTSVRNDGSNGEASGASGSANKLGKSFARQRKATITLTIIIFGFICMWQGFFLILPISVFYPDSVPVILWRIFFWLGYCNSLMNPFIYAAASPEFRRAFKRILCCEFLSSKRKRNLHYEMPTTPRNNPDNRLARCLCFFRPCRSCLMPGTDTAGNVPETPDSSDVLSITHSHLPSTVNNTPSRLSQKSFLGIRLKKRPEIESPDLMETFPLASLTLARLKNPNIANDALYGSLQALQKVVAEDTPHRVRSTTADSCSINGMQEQILTLSRSCSTQTPPVSVPVSPEAAGAAPYRYAFEPSAPDDAEL